MKKNAFKMYLILCLLFSLVTLSCLENENLAGGSSDEETGEISGKLTLDNGQGTGQRHAQYAVVELSRLGSTPGNSVANPVTHSAIANLQGEYSFDNIKLGMYHWKATWVDKNSGAQRVASREKLDIIYYIDLGVDTLRVPGQISTVLTINGINTSDVDCYIPGSTYVSKTNEDGICVLSDVPPGTFDVEFLLNGVVVLRIEDVQVTSGQTTTLEGVTASE